MNERPGVGWVKASAACLAALWLGTAAASGDAMTTAHDLLKNPKFKAAYLEALGSKQKEKWLATLANSGLVRDEAVAGERYQVATPCKPHDCGDNNLLLLYSPGRGVVYGHLYEKGKVTKFGNPSAALGTELEKLWSKEFRQR